MSSVQEVFAARPGTLNRPRRWSWRRRPRGSELAWAVAFAVPYAWVFVAFVVYPGDVERGLVRIDGRWSREEIGAAAELETA